MKKQVILLLALALAVVLPMAFFWVWGDLTNLSATGGGSCGGNCYDFTISSLSQNNSSSAPAHMRHTMFYSDGKFEARSDFATTMNPSVPASILPNTAYGISHDFASGTGGLVTLEMVPTYDDTDRPRHVSIATGGSGGSTPAELTVQTKEIDFFHPGGVNPREGDTIYYVLNYGNTCSVAQNGVIEVAFEAGKVEFLGSRLRFFYNESNVVTNNTTGKLTFNYNGLGAGKSRNVFIPIYFPVAGNNNTGILNFSMFMSRTNGDSCLEPVTDEVKLEHKKGDKPHDPNFIHSDEDNVCVNDFASVKTTPYRYVIGFQNTGKGAANTVKIKSFLPDCFDINSIQMVDPPALNMSKNVATRELGWVLRNQSGGYLKMDNASDHYPLKGTNQSGMTPISPDTRDSVIFTVNFDPTYQPAVCTAIPNLAEIYFDSEPKVLTEFFFTRIGCDTCDVDCAETITTLPTQTYSGTPVQLSTNSGMPNCVWYPSYGLSNPNAASTTAAPKRDMIYTAVCSDGNMVSSAPNIIPCSREIYQVTVLYKKKKAPWPWIIASICLVGVLIFVWGRMRKK